MIPWCVAIFFPNFNVLVASFYERLQPGERGQVGPCGLIGVIQLLSPWNGLFVHGHVVTQPQTIPDSSAFLCIA